MLLTVELAIVLLGLLGLGLWGVVTGVRAAARTRRRSLEPQQLSALTPPFRELMGRAMEIEHDVAGQVRYAPAPLRRDLEELAGRVSGLVGRALPRARQGTRLAGYLLRLEPGDPQHPATTEALGRVEEELRGFLGALEEIRGKVYQVVTDATALAADPTLREELEDARGDIGALEEAFRETRNELA